MPKSERAGHTEGDEESEVPLVTARSVSDERTVFTEENNPDGWIATDLTVSLRE